ncbi:hypothetical protein Psi02_70280 [Planotetraspora silvatica]|uniref:Uncharacterized protein n=1 Tax=Planotetraspora silvatica TaxID=234614 RepID=A0A8J3URI6_9ACTN|nr:hypothetical protein [Planotetraspora silvatica]GII50604.1 hypothetical protein Psi02_70280 [Planotetraspora silvatica]
MTATRAASIGRSIGAAALYAVAAFWVLCSFVATVEADNPEAFPGILDKDEAFGAFFSVSLAVLFAAAAVALCRRPLVSKAACTLIVLVCVYRAISVYGQFYGT